MKARTGIDRIDLYSGIATLAIGLFALVESIRMPRLEHLHINPYTIPGLVPGIIGAVMAVLGLMLVFRALSGRRTGVVAQFEAETPAETETGETGPRTNDATAWPWQHDAGRRVMLTLATTIGYAGLLFGRIPFVIATALFVFAFTLGAEWLNRSRPGPLWRAAAGAAVLGIAAAFAVEFVFVELFRVRLPG